MNKILFLVAKTGAILLSLSFFSCASIMNNERTTMEVHSQPDSATVFFKDGTKVQTPALIIVPRNPHDLSFTVKNDSLTKTIIIPSRVAPEFIFGNLLLGWFSPIGYITDAIGKSKMYNFNSSILVNLSDKKRNYTYYPKSKKGVIQIHGSIPLTVNQRFNNDIKSRNYENYLGLTLGLDYYYSGNNSFSLTGKTGGLGNGECWDNPSEDYYSQSYMLTHNHDIYLPTTENISFSVGYGLSSTQFHYDLYNYHGVAPTILNDYYNYSTSSYSKYVSTRIAAGLCFNARIMLLKYMTIGYNFIPSFYTFGRKKWELQTINYFDWGFKVPIWRPRSKKISTVLYEPKNW